MPPASRPPPLPAFAPTRAGRRAALGVTTATGRAGWGGAVAVGASAVGGGLVTCCPFCCSRCRRQGLPAPRSGGLTAFNRSTEPRQGAPASTAGPGLFGEGMGGGKVA